MSESNWYEDFFMNISQRAKCFFGFHDPEIHEVLIYRPPYEESRFYVTCCGWCGSMKYGARGEK